MAWFDDFKHCMHSSYGVTVPDSAAAVLAEAYVAVDAIKKMAAVIEEYGAATDLSTLVGAGLASEVAEVGLAVLGALGVGGAVGALIECGVIDPLTR